MTSQVDDYQKIFLSGVPLMDTRAPVEFRQGSFPTAENLPLMTNDERTQVGTCYKQRGQQAAIELGHQLVKGEIKATRIASWTDFAHRHPQGYLFCFRGGLRSQIVQQWLHETGVDYPRITGGYKAMRRFLIDTTDQAMAECPLILLSGMTGSGKTELLARLGNGLDLEGHANHRGSSFGRLPTPQPTPINFENALAIDLLRQRDQGHQWFVVEDENQTIGRLPLPLSLVRAMQQSPMVILEAPLEERIERVLQDYVINLRQAFTTQQGEIQGQAAFASHLQDALNRIRKRLGSARHLELSGILQTALTTKAINDSQNLHRNWINKLLTDYYDPMYRYQEQQKTRQINYRGRMDELVAWLQHHHPA